MENKTAVWQSDTFTIESFQLENGTTLPNIDTAFITCGKLNNAKSNAILVLHGYTSSHKFVCGNDGTSSEGTWAQLIGPGKAIDTNKYFVIAPNALGSCFGSTGPASIDPTTKQAYGPTFPDITFRDIVATQYELVRHLGINRLRAVAGVSMGGFATWQWGTQYPNAMKSLIVILSSLSGQHVVPENRPNSLQQLQSDPHWNNGWIYDSDAIRPALQRLRKNTLLSYGAAASANEATSDIDNDQCIYEQAWRWANEFDPNSLVVLSKAMRSFNVAPQIENLTADVFLMLATTDRLFPAAKADETLDVLRRNRVPYTYLALETVYGHQSSGLEWRKWEHALRDFLE